MRRNNMVVTVVLLLSMASFWAMAVWLVPQLLALRWAMPICCLWAVILGLVLHGVHCHSTKHRSVLGGVKFLFVLLLLLAGYVILWQLWAYFAPPLGFGGNPLPDLLHYPKLWLNTGINWVIVLLAGTGNGGILGWLNSYQWQYLPVVVTCLAAYLAGHLFTVCFRR